MCKKNISEIYKKILWKLPYSIRYSINKYKNYDNYKKSQKLRGRDAEGNKTSLKGFDDLSCIFVHIPKAGGVSINKVLFGNLGGSHMTIKNYQMIFNKKDFIKYYKFTFIRNPWDRLVSTYFFLKEDGFHQNDKKWFKDNISKYNSFNNFVLNWLRKENICTEIHFVPQYEFITVNNIIAIDDVFKLEDINNAWEIIKKRLNVNKKLSHHNITINRKNDYRKYYSEKTKEIVKEIYSKDIELFGYKF